ncbi:peptide deformylase [Mycobacterium sp. 3519A]|uniref:peptide deformylase n=1 Tax=Mycobacterium sp. 3519A TaxID=2057184 RepID=UPI000C7D2423|nr:peptide deformylase [Mycobacterium sp. 3519A]
MAVLPIRILGDPVLHRATRAVPVSADGGLPDWMPDLVTNLYDTLAASKGVGLSANQIGVDVRVFVYDCPEVRGQPERHRGCVVNPVLEISDLPAGDPDPTADEEGCLSAPGEKFPIRRATWARVTGLEADGSPTSVEGRGLIARMLQHETAHLDGRLYIDDLVPPYASQAAEAIIGRGWAVPGLAWTPGVDRNPFSERDDLQD